MKSIKEKAEEHLNSVYAGYDDVLKKLVKESYVSGANYVLGEIDEFMQDNPHVNFESYKAIKDKIAQLKK